MNADLAFFDRIVDAMQLFFYGATTLVVILVGKKEDGLRGRHGVDEFFIFFPVSLAFYTITSTHPTTLADCLGQYNKKCVNINHLTIFLSNFDLLSFEDDG
ncbi:MAG: hypothetical protein PHI06_11035 [Desulfobulbaceae bacterium]|nr:hypothetical protein [Desulfobulbaceae bacterium]